MLEYGILVFTSLITLMNPIGIVPTFLSLTDGNTVKEQQKIARKASITVFICILLFAGLGDFIFKFFGITINGLRIVGGIVMIRMGFDLLNGHSAKMKKENLDHTHTDPDDISVTPLGFPIIAGAGTITTAIVLGNQATSYAHIGIFVFVAFLVSLISYIILGNGAKIMSALGKNGRSIMNRVMGLILMMIAIEFFFAGVKPVLIDVGRQIMK